MNSNEIRTERLLLRKWRPADRAPFAALNADPRVMKYFPSVLSPEESDAVVDRIAMHWEEHGFGVWVVEVPDGAPFIGCVGLLVPRFEAHFTPCVEILWRLAAQYWNQGYATEAARAALQFGFERLNLSEIVALTIPANTPSRRVMEKIGMVHDPRDDFDHPSLPAGHPLSRHVLYRVHRKEMEQFS
jgi:RimJ/RimL family protein N-acetyltransferase